MTGQPIPAKDIRVEIIHGGDAAGHQRRVHEWLERAAEVNIVDIQHTVMHEPKSVTGVGFSTMIIYTEP